jgi:hypothetical protein
MNHSVQYSDQPSQLLRDMNLQQPQQAIGDFIEKLPADTSVPSHNEIRIVDQLFQQKKSIFDSILHQTKDILVMGVLFIIFSLPFVDNLITKFVTIASTSPYILIGIKALLFVLSYFIIMNLYIAKKNT